MPRKYKPKVGARNYRNYSNQQIEDALRAIENGSCTLNEAARTYSIPAATLSRKKRGLHTLTPGRPTALTTADEDCLAKSILAAGDWGFPLSGYDVRLIVKSYLDRVGINERRFQSNFPGTDWLRGFIERHKNVLSERLCQNIKRSRAAVDASIINGYFDELDKSLKDVSPEYIVNYDETNMTDDPQRKKVLVRRGCKHPDRVMDSSKSSISVMFSGAASGSILPPYVCYKAEHLYQTWMERGPAGCRYNRSKNGWFNGAVFEDWFTTIALPHFKKATKGEPKVLIGDNLSSHLSVYVINTCKEYNIRFVLLPTNSTHLWQPLDVAFFRPLKMQWRQVLEEWKLKNRGTLPKDKFPYLLAQCLHNLNRDGCAKKNLVSGFSATGIVPLDGNKILKRLPTPTTPETRELRETSWSESLNEFFQEFRQSETQPKQPVRRKRLAVLPGKSIGDDDLPVAGTSGEKDQTLSEEEYEIDNPKLIADFINKTKKKKQIEKVYGKTKENVSFHDSSSDLDMIEDESDFEESIEKNTSKSLNRDDLEVGNFVVVDLKYDKGTKKEKTKKFVGQILKISSDKCLVKFFRKSNKAENIYVFPDQVDQSEVRKQEIVETVKPLFERRGRYCFPVEK